MGFQCLGGGWLLRSEEAVDRISPQFGTLLAYKSHNATSFTTLPRTGPAVRALNPRFLMEPIRWLQDKDRVLLVDDEVALTNLWREVLESTGRYAVQEANCPTKVIQTAQEFRPHIIFMDRDIHGTDGGELAAELRLDAELSSVPIVFVTGSVSRREAALHGLFGGMPTLAKPFTSEALVRLAGVVLDRHRRPWSGNDLRSVFRETAKETQGPFSHPIPSKAA